MGQFLTAYEQWFSKTTDAPVEFGHAGGLVVLSTLALGRRWLEQGSGKIQPNLNILLTADSSRDRKSTSVRAAVRVLRELEPKRIGPEDFTAEGIISHMRRRGAGGTHNRLLIPLEEFGTYLATARQSYGQNLSADMCKLYDGNTFKRVRSGKRAVEIKDPIVSIFGGVAYGMLEKYADPMEWSTGFFARIIFVTPIQRRPEIVPPPAPAPIDFQLVLSAAKQIKVALKATRGSMTLMPAAVDIYRGWVSHIRKDGDEDPVIVAQRERLANAVLKISMLYQIDAEHSRPVTAAAMDAATQFGTRAWAAFKMVRAVTAGSTLSRQIRRVWKAITTAGETGISRRELYRMCHLTIDEAVPVLNVLLQAAVVANAAFKGKTGPDAHGYKVLIPYSDVHDA